MSCKLSPMEKVGRKCQILFSVKNKKNKINHQFVQRSSCHWSDTLPTTNREGSGAQGIVNTRSISKLACKFHSLGLHL